MTVLMITRSDGGVSVMQVAEGADPKVALRKWSDVHPGEYVSHRPGSLDELPNERTFRNAWRDAGKIDVDMPQARNIWRDKMRQTRAPLLAALDVEFIRAVERGDSAAQARIATDKQSLRDVTAHPAIERAKTPEELKAVWPDVLA